jgi:esterase/lipase superfamily enzyme
MFAVLINQRLLVNAALLLLLLFLFSIPLTAFSQKSQGFPENDTRPVVDEQMANDIILSVIEITAEHFGVEKNTLNADTNLADELFADAMDIYEVIARTLEFEYRLARNIPGDIVTIRQIADFVAHANYQVMMFEYRGPDSIKSTPMKEVYLQRIFFGTNRQPTGKSLPDEVFSGKRSSEMKTSFGTALISIPKSHARGKLELPMNFGFFEQQAVPEKHFILKKLEILDWNSFIDQINKDLKPLAGENSTAEDVLIFIHGFNVPFKQAALRTGQIAYDLRFQGAPVLFSWPARGGILSYVSDRAAVEWSVNYIEQFLIDVIKNTRGKRYHLIAHSMGNQGFIPALLQIALRGKHRDNPLFENIILAAPDFDARKFTEQIVPEVLSLSNRWTIYASEKDAALKASKLLRMDTSQRLGQPLSVINGMDTIDASGFEVSPWNLSENHGYFSSKNRVISDVRSVLKGFTPKSRDLLERFYKGKSYWWIKTE